MIVDVRGGPNVSRKGTVILIRRLTSPTVKVRRLGYFAAICDLLQKQRHPEHLLPRILARWAVEHKDSLEVHSKYLPVTRKGGSSIVGEIILPERGEPRAAHRYIETAVELGLIVFIGGESQNTKVGHVLAAVPSLDNVFDMSMARRFVLFRAILERDYLYLKALIGLITGNEDTNGNI